MYIFVLKNIYFLLKLKRSFIINGLLQYFGNTSCHYQAKISKEKKQILEIQIHKTTINKLFSD